jgi:hypothetical protein
LPSVKSVGKTAMARMGRIENSLREIG